MFLLTPAEMAASPRIAADAVSTVLGPVGGSLISLAIVISTFGVVGIYTLTAPRIYYAMAADGVFFRKVAEIHPRFGTPAFSIMFQSLWAAVLDPVLGHVREPDLVRRLHRLDLLRAGRRQRHRPAPHDAGRRAAVPRARATPGCRCSSSARPPGSSP